MDCSGEIMSKSIYIKVGTQIKDSDGKIHTVSKIKNYLLFGRTPRARLSFDDGAPSYRMSDLAEDVQDGTVEIIEAIEVKS